jgi:TerY-C metal binding domain
LAKADGVVGRFNLNKNRHIDVGVDERFAIFVARCQETKLPYLIKYEQRPAGFKIKDPVLAAKLNTPQFVLKKTYMVKNTYFELGGGDEPAPKVNSMKLIGSPNCPHCGTPHGFAVCGCGKVHCIGGLGQQTCPWCGSEGYYGHRDGAEGSGFEISRGRG